MSTLQKLRQRQQLRQAAESSLEALLGGGDGDGEGAAAPAAASSSSSALPGGSCSGRDGGGPGPLPAQLPAKRAAASPPSSGGNASEGLRPPFSAAVGNCPTTLHELQACVLRFVCGSTAFGPLPISGVGLNAALRREYMRAGCSRSALAVFRAGDTVEAIRMIHRELHALQCADALVLDEVAEDGEEDVLVIESNPERIFHFMCNPGNRAGETALESWSASSAKRVRHFNGVGNGGAGELFDAWPYNDALRGPYDAHLVPLRPNGGVGGSRGLGAIEDVESVEDLLKAPTARQRRLIDAGDELRQLLAEPTARQSLTAQKFMNKSQNMAQFCPHGSRADCRRAMGSTAACAKIHFKKIIKPWTDESLGDCSYLDTCRHIDKCKYVHYALDLTVEQAKYLNECGVQNRGTDTKRINELAMKGMELPSQWIQCDLKVFPLSIFKDQVSVVMADPPWDIHMELPYGTLTDDEVRNLKIGDIHEDGMIFLWVTGRAMELARECFKIWGYKRIEEIIWVKTNQLQRIIRTGRTGHWINHAKEHCLVGIKGNPRLNRNLDCDVIVSEVRETSRKPDEIYNLIERMFPNCLKLELFGRPHNVHENWITCGNQLDGVRICDEEIVRRYNNEFPNEPIEAWKKESEAVLPVFAGEGGSCGTPRFDTERASGGNGSSGATTDGQPWIPPHTQHPSGPSSADAWVPPSSAPAVVLAAPAPVTHEAAALTLQQAAGGAGKAA
mmetsp:Transcript_44627/g.123678  ORF Transcript_44627/g.123678 Transcript_44627/m.123678 type:complete len:731 (+) Transcript_44627:124-2316(+)|eukprot:CAMPEP_0117585204 /NCGR_PEP_ID=MMETSP0784-20121206/68017_1 /TAXON_ID=39447 /ORGANISM="" /LENGTH=730 /DNA_ID=CAMNT_0005386129 /DNA_START=53 /DNA_END=2245 /DNA_ORIENTATION=-